jgi:hypothetical protein
MGKLKKQYNVAQIENFVVIECEDYDTAFEYGINIILKIKRDENMSLFEKNSGYLTEQRLKTLIKSR